MTDPTTTCPGCGIETFVGERIRHAKGCAIALADAAAKLARQAAPRERARSVLALTECSDPEVSAALHRDYLDHDK